jgi:hypothetical protein
VAREKSYRSENDVKREIKRLLDKHGWFHWTAAAGAFSATGIADRLALRAGVFLAVEAKFGKNRPTRLQKAYLQSIMAEGGFGFCANETHLPILQTWLETFDRASQAFAQGQKPAHEDGALLLDCVRALTELTV